MSPTEHRQGTQEEPERRSASSRAKAGVTAVVSVVAVLALIVVGAGGLLAASDAAKAKHRHGRAVKTVKVRVTKTVKVPGPTKTVTATATATVTATKTVSVPGPTRTVTVTPSATSTATSTGGPAGGRVLPYFGAAVQNNGDPAPVEAAAGRVLGLHRTYWNYAKIDASVAQAKADVKAGRIPWISYKLPVSWADAANGKVDAQTKQIAAKLATVPGPVWVAIHHEPEGDGPMPDWVAMQRRLLPLLAAAPNVRTSIILSAWNTFLSGNPAYSVEASWPGSMVDILGFDAYNPYGDDKHPNKGWRELEAYYDQMAPAAKKLGVDWAIAETGYTDSAAAKDPDWLTRAYDDMANRADLPGIGLCYFDSVANSIGTWALNKVKEPKFDAVLARSHAVLPH